MIQSPENNVIVKVKTKYIGNISKILQLSSIQNGASVDSVDLVNIIGEVVSLPRTISNKIGYKGFSTKDINIGDTAIFSYSIIHDFVIPSEDADPIYRNRMFYKGEEYFLADITKIFGVIRDGEIKMINGYVMASTFSESVLVLPSALKKLKKAAETEATDDARSDASDTSNYDDDEDDLRESIHDIRANIAAAGIKHAAIIKARLQSRNVQN